MLRQLIERVRGVLIQPRQALPLTLAESGAARTLFFPYVALLAALGPIAIFLSDGVIGAWHSSTEIFNTTIPGGLSRAPGPAAVEAVLTFAIGVGGWVGLAAAMELLAPWFGGLRDRAGATKAAAYALTPVWVAEATLIFGSVPYLGWVPAVALVGGIAWAAFVAVVALPLHLGTPDAKSPGHALAALGITAVAATAIYFLLSALVYSAWSSRIS